MNKINKRFLIAEPIVFVEKQFYLSEKKAKLFKHLFIYFNILTMFATFAILVLSTLVVSKVIFNGIPTWYFYATTFLSALLTLVTSLVNFFYVKEKYEINNRLHQYIKGEITKYSAKTGIYNSVKNPKTEIFHKVCLMLEYKSAREVEDERK